MKAKNNFEFLLLMLSAIVFVAVVGCEGPAGEPGPAGTDGTDGVAGNVTCLECHSGENIQNIRQEFSQSVHSAGQVAVDYAGGRSYCAECHSSEGFIEFAATGDVAENISAPSPWECKTCHDIHTTFAFDDYALRLADPISFISDNTTTVDFGNSNLCVNCHQARRPEPNVSAPGTTFEITSTHYGPHHSAAGNVLYGAGYAEIAGSVSYPAAGSNPHMTDLNDNASKCVGCHMGESSDPGQGGHTWNASLDACNACHGTSETDFNYGNVRAEIEAQLVVLRDLLVARGVVEQAIEDVYEINQETGNIELVTTMGGYHPVVGTFPMMEVQAFYNWIGLEEDRSLGAHNPKYVKALLTNTIEALQ